MRADDLLLAISLIHAASVAIIVLTFAAHQAFVLRAVRRDVQFILRLLTIWARMWGAPGPDVAKVLEQEIAQRVPRSWWER